MIYDRAGRHPEFIEHFHKLLARSQNARRGRRENFWASEQTCVVKLGGREAVLDKRVYTATNPVAKHLVERVHPWPGVNGLSALLDVTTAARDPSAPLLSPRRPDVRDPRARADHPRRARPRCRRDLRAAPACTTVSWIGPPSDSEPAGGSWGDERCSRNRGASSPSAASPGDTCARAASPNQWARIEALMRNRTFDDHADARARWRNGVAAAFPAGTCGLQRFASVPILQR